MNRPRSQRGTNQGGGRNSKLTKAPLKGLFSDGIWKCNCDPRLPAQHFQTKNGGKNHGRWFYTCQLPQPKRCDFFLWDDEAKSREAAAVLKNSRTEPGQPAPVTPTKSINGAVTGTGLMTPETGGRNKGWSFLDRSANNTTPATLKPNGIGNRDMERGAAQEKIETQATATTADGSDEEFYDWPASDEEALEKVVDEASGHSSSTVKSGPPLPETPRKAARTEELTSPGKRRFDDLNDTAGGSRGYPTPATGLNGDDVFAVPSTGRNAGKGLFAPKPVGLDSPDETPTPIRYKDVPNGTDSELASEILTTLARYSVALPADAKEAVKNLCNRHVLFTRGIMKGRDVSRAMVKSKDERLVEMKVEVEGLKSERETDRAVIRHLRRDMAQRKEAMR